VFAQVDFYGATPLMGVPDDQLLHNILTRYLPVANPAYAGARVVDSWWVMVFSKQGVTTMNKRLIRLGGILGTSSQQRFCTYKEQNTKGMVLEAGKGLPANENQLSTAALCFCKSQEEGQPAYTSYLLLLTNSFAPYFANSRHAPYCLPASYTQHTVLPSLSERVQPRQCSAHATHCNHSAARPVHGR
jgi:hypothetical protein